MDTDLAKALGDIQHSLGSIEGKFDSHLAAFAQHIKDDAAMAANIKTLELANAKQRGFAKAITLVGVVLGTATGWLVERFGFGHHG